MKLSSSRFEEEQRLRFMYNGKTRVVEPQCYGIGTKGTELLRAHQLQGGSQRAPLFDVAKIKDHCDLRAAVN